MKKEEEYVEISRGKRLASNLVAAIGIFICGAVLLVFGLTGESVGVSVASLIAPVILSSLGLIFLTTSLIQGNSVTLYLAVILLVCAVVSFVANLTEVTYGMLYPLYISSPAIASAITMIMSKDYNFHLKIIVIFAVPAIFFAFFAAELWTVAVLVPALIMYAGFLALYAALAVNSVAEE